MTKYSKEEKEIIDKVKAFLKNIRTLKNEKLSLQLEYEDIPGPQSPSLSNEAPGGYSKPKEYQLDSYVLRRELLLKRIELFNNEIDKFTLALYVLKAGQRNIVNCYINSHSYSDMIQELESSYYISESTYTREIPKICLKLASYIDYENSITIDDLNRRYNDYLSGMTVK